LNFYNEISLEKIFLTIAGDVNTVSAKASVKKAFGLWNTNKVYQNEVTSK